MDAILELLRQLIDPDWIMAHGGLFLVAFIIFAETGLFIGFFLPGDSLLFITGMIIAGAKTNPIPFESHPLNLIFWIILLTIAAILGNMVGYWFGKKSGPLLFERKETWLFKRKHLQNAHDFYDKRGGTAIIVARFLPIVRTFAPIVAGVVHMDYKKFVLFNIIGAVGWIAGLTTLGFLLGENAWIKEHLEWIIIGLVLVTTAPVAFKMFFSKMKPVPPVLKSKEKITSNNPG
jgi:membrane-associated protein